MHPFELSKVKWSLIYWISFKTPFNCNSYSFFYPFCAILNSTCSLFVRCRNASRRPLNYTLRDMEYTMIFDNDERQQAIFCASVYLLINVRRTELNDPSVTQFLFRVTSCVFVVMRWYVLLYFCSLSKPIMGIIAATLSWHRKTVTKCHADETTEANDAQN